MLCATGYASAEPPDLVATGRGWHYCRRRVALVCHCPQDAVLPSPIPSATLDVTPEQTRRCDAGASVRASQGECLSALGATGFASAAAGRCSASDGHQLEHYLVVLHWQSQCHPAVPSIGSGRVLASTCSSHPGSSSRTCHSVTASPWGPSVRASQGECLSALGATGFASAAAGRCSASDGHQLEHYLVVLHWQKRPVELQRQIELRPLSSPHATAATNLCLTLCQ